MSEYDFSRLWEGIQDKIDMSKVMKAKGSNARLEKFKKLLEKQTDQCKNITEFKTHNLRELMDTGIGQTDLKEIPKGTRVQSRVTRRTKKIARLQKIKVALKKEGLTLFFIPSKAKGRGRKPTIQRLNLKGTAKHIRGTLTDGKKITIVRRKDTGNFNVYVQGVRGMFTHIKKPTKK